MATPETIVTPPIETGIKSHPLVKGLITLGKLGAYLTGADLLIIEQLNEAKLGKQYLGDPFALPTEHSPQTALKIGFDRTKVAVATPVVLALRWTGIDGLHRLSRRFFS